MAWRNRSNLLFLLLVLPHIVNGAIFTSAFSAGNSFLFCSSRVLYGLALRGQAPKILTYCTKKGLPLYAVLTSVSPSFNIWLDSFLNVPRSPPSLSSLSWAYPMAPTKCLCRCFFFLLSRSISDELYMFWIAGFKIYRPQEDSPVGSSWMCPTSSFVRQSLVVFILCSWTFYL